MGTVFTPSLNAWSSWPLGERALSITVVGVHENADILFWLLFSK